MSKRQRLPLPMDRGEWTGGDAATMPNGFARKKRNLVWADTDASRPPFTYDGLPAARGLAIWFDESTGTHRLYAVDAVGGFNRSHVKAASGEAWTALGLVDRYVQDWTNFRGQLYWLSTQSSATVAGYVRSYNGNGTGDAAVKLDGYYFGTIQPRSICICADRLIIGGATIYVVNLLHAATVYSYDAANWTRTNVTASASAVGASGTIYQITPTSTTASSLEAPISQQIDYQIETLRWRSDLRSGHPTYSMPMTMQWRHVWLWATGEAVAVGDIRIPVARNNFRYRATVAGTTAAGEPVWPTTVGATVADNGITWMCDGSDVAASTEFYLQSVSEQDKFTTNECVVRASKGTRALVRPVLKFGNTSTPAVTLAGLDFAFKDSLADGNLRKQSYGQQVTGGEFPRPFYNVDATNEAYIPYDDTLLWTDPGEEIVRGSNTYRLREEPGMVTSVVAISRTRFVAFKRKSATVMTAQEDFNNPFLPESGAFVGCLGSKAADKSEHDGAIYFIGEDGVYRWNVGSEPEELCGEAKLREMFDKSTATWVETQASPANRALLTIDQKNKRVLVYVQKGIIHCYDIRRQAWGRIDAGGDDSFTARGYQICDMIYNPGTGFVYVAFTEAATGTAGLARLDDTQVAAEDQISSSGTLPVYFDITPRPIEGRPRADLQLDELYAYVDCTVAGQSATTLCSFDQGATWEITDPARDLLTTEANYEPERFGIWNSWGTMLPRILIRGKAGPGALKVSGLEADVITKKLPEYPKTAP